jgi:hypothetical protein
MAKTTEVQDYDLVGLRETPVYQAEASVQHIVSDLKRVVALDQTIEQKQREMTQWMIGCILGAIAVFIALIVASGLSSAMTIALVIVLIGLIGGIIVTSRKRGQFVAINIPNYRYQLLPKLLTMLVRDMDKQAPVSTHLVLNPPLRIQKCTFDGPHPHRSGWNLKRYDDQWLTLEGELLDRTRFQLLCTESWVTAAGWKRGRSGKRKYKTKSKSKGFELALALRVPRKKYGALPVLTPAAREAIQLPKTCSLKRLEVEDNSLYLRVKMLPPPENPDVQVEQLYQAITLMFLSLYHILNLAKVLSDDKTEAS